MEPGMTFVTRPGCGPKVKSALRRYKSGQVNPWVTFLSFAVGLAVSMVASTSTTYGFGNGVPSAFRLVTHLGLGLGVATLVALLARRYAKERTRKIVRKACNSDIICFKDDDLLAHLRELAHTAGLDDCNDELASWLHQNRFDELTKLGMASWRPDKGGLEATRLILKLLKDFKDHRAEAQEQSA